MTGWPKCEDCVHCSKLAIVPVCLRTGKSTAWERAATLPGDNQYGKNCGLQARFKELRREKVQS